MSDNEIKSPSNFIKQKTPYINYDSARINIKHILLQVDDPLVAGKIIKDIKYDDNGKLWILSEFELGVITYDDLCVNSEQHSIGNKIKGNYKTVVEIDGGARIFIDNLGVIWANTERGLFRVISKANSYEIERIDYGSNSEIIDDFISTNTSGGKFWIGHFDDNLKLFDKDRKAFYPLTFETYDINNLYNNGVSCFLRTRSNVMFIGTAWGGLYKFNPNFVLSNFHPQLQAIHQNQTSNLRYVYEDTKGYIWMIARDIYRCDKNTGEILDTFDDRFFNHKWSYSNNILEDKNGRFWVGMESMGLI